MPTRAGFQTVLDEIDAFNGQDPLGRELDYSIRLSRWIEKLNPQAGEALRLAARGQHIGRWTIPRESYPMDRAGYLRWREELKRFHAKTVGDLMLAASYPSESIERVRSIILKKNLTGDPDVQTLEDALCLVFLETQLGDLAAKTPEPKMIEIIRKTWKKMSEQARRAALALPLPGDQLRLVQAALKAG